MEDLRRDLIRRHGITESEMWRFNQGFMMYIAPNSEMTEQQLVEFVRPQVARARTAAARQSNGRTPSPRVSSSGQPVNIRGPRKKKTGKKIGIIAIAVFLLVASGSCQKNTSKDTTKDSTKVAASSQKAATSVVTEKPTPETIKVETLPTTVVGQDQVTLNVVLLDTTGVSADTVKELAASSSSSVSVSETVPEIEDVDVVEDYQPITMSFYDASDLKGRGVRDYAGEPNYVGSIGYAAVYTEADLESVPGYTDTPWTVPTYIKVLDSFVQSGFITHKTKIGIISQELSKQNGREYEGFLEFQDLDTGLVGYISVKNFVTIPYWDQDVTKAVTKGYGIAVFRQTSQYTPVDKNGKKVSVTKDSQVLLPARGTYYVSTMDRVDYQIVGIVFEKQNNKTVPQYVFFNKNDLRMVY